MNQSGQHLLLRRLPHLLDARLNYAFGLEKTLLLAAYLRERQELTRRALLGGEAETRELIGLCRLLFLQRPADRAEFDDIVREALKQERREYQRLLEASLRSAFPEAHTAPESERIEAQPQPAPAAPPEPAPPGGGEAALEEETYRQPEQGVAMLPTRIQGVAIDDPQAAEEQVRARARRGYIFSKDYLPVSHRELAKGWRYLQFKVFDRPSEEIELPATVRLIAREGLFTEPVFVPRLKNAAGRLIILCDRRGSMTPFHALSDAIVHAARTDGGHAGCELYHFQNYPEGYLVDPAAREGEHILALDVFMRRLALAPAAVLIISDAGAARGHFSGQRVKAAAHFLRQLKRHAAAAAWLNPMPLSRWTGSSAAQIARHVAMFPLLESGAFSFEKAIKALRGQES